MNPDVVIITVKGVMPTDSGCAVFLGDESKTFLIFVDHFVGHAMQMTLKGIRKERPHTHDLIGSILLGLETKLERILINDFNKEKGTYFARVLLRMENELGRKLVEIDARPSDSIVLALQQQRPILVARSVYDGVDDMTEELQKMLKQQAEQEENEGGSSSA